ncbi:MAG TPA: SDR family NAD(P)-dependent oxidoreductase [Streptosporangiaceae bacterium]|nr:SDR family NAD(P)-dependent oxidoreductase [Streptosporangiaceae bacterium]
MDSFTGKLAVVTGGGSGMGRELTRQLAAQGCSVAGCDLNPDTMAETVALAQAEAPSGARVIGHACDVADEAQVLRFRDEVLAEHASDHVDLVFANAGVFGGASFVKDSRQEWERTFNTNWWGVYFCVRTFLPLLIASGDGVRVQVAGRDRASLRRQLADKLTAHAGTAAGHDRELVRERVHGHDGYRLCQCSSTLHGAWTSTTRRVA